MKPHPSFLYSLILHSFALFQKAQEPALEIRINTLSQDVSMLPGQGGNIGVFHLRSAHP